MTDLEKLKALLTEFGVGFEEEPHSSGVTIHCHEGMNKVVGYTSFFTDFEFELDGKFNSMGAWE